MFMSLQNKGLAELKKLASNLRMQIARNPNIPLWRRWNWKMLRGGLGYAEWIRLRRKESKPGPRSDDDLPF